MQEVNDKMENSFVLTPEQRKDYSRHLMPCLKKPGGFSLKGGEGIYIEDLNGKKYMDFTSEQFVCLLGFGNKEIAEAVYRQALNMPMVAPLHQTDLRYSLYHKLASVAPKHLNRISFTIGGGLAIESAMKIALKNVPGSRNFVSLYGGYHGTTFGTADGTFLSGRGDVKEAINKSFFQYANKSEHHFIRTERPYCYRCPFGKEAGKCGLECADCLKRTILCGVSGPVAGVIIEPVQSGGGQIPFPKEYLKRVREICDEVGTVLIFDEIQTFGRTGKFFAAEYYDVEPDIIVFAKGVGGGIPIGGILIHDRLEGFDNLMEDMQTFQNNHLSYAAAMKTIEIIERDRLLANAVATGSYMTDRLKKMQQKFGFIGDVRGPGLAIGVELVKDPVTKDPVEEETMNKLFERCVRHGLFYQAAHNIIKLKPPLIISMEQAETAMDILEECFDEGL
ncbi:aminotransferase class III-fold pyridoxal phosphate-dependent enzyme [Lachnotalea sp. AF33-28]|nr:aminotransferase class III-fold pyridoxal phosphate-dependent enzyme [Lachnotalea sp. AF33-28]